MQTASLEWNPVLEHRLKEAKQRAGWRWIGYTLALLSLGVLWLMVWATAEFDGGAAFTGDTWWFVFVPSGLMLLLALLLALPAEKSAKVAKELKVQKAAALSQSAAAPPVAVVALACLQCKSPLDQAARFCGQCGLPRAS